MQLISEQFDESQLRLLTYYLYLDFDELSGTQKTEKAQALISHFEERQTLNDLTDFCEIERPLGIWEEIRQTIIRERQAASLPVEQLLISQEQEILVRTVPQEKPVADTGWLELDELENPYMRLAWCINAYLASLDLADTQNDSLTKELKGLGLQIGGDESLESWADQIRSYCELYCQPYPIRLIRKKGFNRFLRGLFTPYFLKQQLRRTSTDDLMEALGFQKREVFRGATIIWQSVLSSREQLELTNIDQNTLYGIGVRAINNVEELLEYVISFYGRWIVNPVDAARASVKLVPDIPSKWTRFAGWCEGKWRLGIPDAIEVIEHLNLLVVAMPEFFDFFHRHEVMEKDHLERIRHLYKQRLNYVHSREWTTRDYRSYLQATREFLDDLLPTIGYLKEKVIPSVVLIQRALTFGDGLIRLDYIDEEGNIQHDRYEQVGFFAPQVESFFYSPNHELPGNKGLHTSRIPIIVPVTILWSKSL